jgi:hypothetical protein
MTLPTNYTDNTTPTGATTELPATTARGINTINGQINSNTSAITTLQQTTPSDYVISIVGSTIYATPRAGSGLTAYSASTSGSGPSTVIQSAINALTPAGALGSGGGKIHICHGTYFLANGLTIVGLEGISGSSSQPGSCLFIEGEGIGTTLLQNTSGQHALKINNCACVVLRDIHIYAGTNAFSCIYAADDGSTSEMSMWKAVLDNVHCDCDGTTHPAVELRNFFDVAAPFMRVQSANHALMLKQTGATTKYGNSWFGSVVASAGTGTPYAALWVGSTNTSAVLDMITIDNFQSTAGAYYGIYGYAAGSINFKFVDIEAVQYAVYLDGPGTGSYANSSAFTVDGGFMLPYTQGIHVTANSYGHVIRNVFMQCAGNGTIPPLVDARGGTPASTYDLQCLTAADIAAISLAFTGTKLRAVGNDGTVVETYSSNPPAHNNSTGVVGQITWDSGYVYVCTAANTWKRVALNVTSW